MIGLVITLAIESLVGVNHQYVPLVLVAAPAFLGTAISLILSFKLNQSYDRSWEARKIWGAIVDDSRTFVGQALKLTDPAFPKGPKDIVVRLARRQIAQYDLPRAGAQFQQGTSVAVSTCTREACDLDVVTSAADRTCFGVTDKITYDKPCACT